VATYFFSLGFYSEAIMYITNFRNVWGLCTPWLSILRPPKHQLWLPFKTTDHKLHLSHSTSYCNLIVLSTILWHQSKSDLTLWPCNFKSKAHKIVSYWPIAVSCCVKYLLKKILSTLCCITPTTYWQDTKAWKCLTKVLLWLNWSCSIKGTESCPLWHRHMSWK